MALSRYLTPLYKSISIPAPDLTTPSSRNSNTGTIVGTVVAAVVLAIALISIGLVVRR